MKRTLATAVLVVALFMDLMDAMITNIALPAIRDDMNASSAQLEWTLTGYILAFAVGLIPGGRLGDSLGRRTVFLAGIALFTATSILASSAWTGNVLVGARVGQGLGAALMVPQVMATVLAVYSPRERGPILGVMTALGGLGILTGQLVGGFLVTADLWGQGWRSIFWINVPIGIALIIGAVAWVPQTRSPRPVAIDSYGVVLAAVAVFSVIFPLTAGNSAGWPWWCWALLALGVVAAIAFVRSQRRSPGANRADPLVPLHLFSRRSYAIGSLVQLTYQIGWGSFALMLGIYVQEALHFTAFEAGLTMVGVTLGSFAGTALAPYAARVGRSAAVAGGVLQIAGFFWYGATLVRDGPEFGVWSALLPLAVTGVGMTLLAVPLISVSLAEVDSSDAGAASGVFSMLQQLGYALGIALVGVPFFGVIGSGSSQATYENAIGSGNWITIGAFVLATALAGLMPRTVALHTPESQENVYV